MAAAVELRGIGVSAGVADGPACTLAAAPELPAADAAVADPEAEVARTAAALEQVAADLDTRAASASGAAAEVLTAEALMARDPTLADRIGTLIRVEGRDGPHAVDAAFAEHRAMFLQIGGYLAERVSDLDDLRTRAVAALLGLPMPGIPSPGHPFVLLADDLAPADTATLDPAEVLAIVTRRGGPTGHTAILAKQLGIPAVTACDGALGLPDGTPLLVDGQTGVVVRDPEPGQITRARADRAVLVARRAASHGPGRTADGHAVSLYVNVGGAADAAAGSAAGAQGVGLLRTEFLFHGRQTAPTRAEQVAAYAAAFAPFAGRTVIVRTLDVGADKPLAYLPMGEEENPALGVRGLRLARRSPELLQEQLEAIAEAAAQTGADAWVMAPMVATAFEAETFAVAARAAGIARVGVMIEVPAAALCADAILEHVDFASLGTNDLAQYAMAADRLAGELADLLDPWQPAVLQLIALAAAAGARAGKPVGVCGEAASDPLLALVLAGLGVTSLSMAAGCLADVRGTLAAHTQAACRDLAAAALASPSAPDARAAVAERSRELAVA